MAVLRGLTAHRLQFVRDRVVTEVVAQVEVAVVAIAVVGLPLFHEVIQEAQEAHDLLPHPLLQDAEDRNSIIRGLRILV